MINTKKILLTTQEEAQLNIDILKFIVTEENDNGKFSENKTDTEVREYCIFNTHISITETGDPDITKINQCLSIARQMGFTQIMLIYNIYGIDR